jgi:(S)-3,5-dihydroxyphenylglycine transaminase
MGLVISDLHSSLGSSSIDKVNFLNEVAKQYPEAISFASGSPSKGTYNVESFSRYIDSFVDYLQTVHHLSYEEAYGTIGNYASAKGIICESLAKMAYTDEGIVIDPKAIVVTTGAQEAIALSIQTLCRPEQDVLLVVSPFYSGVEGAAKIFGLQTGYVNESPDGIDIGDLKRSIQQVKNQGKTPKAIYCTPNYSNPTGICMTLENRLEFMQVCNEHKITMIEDNTYGFLGWSTRPPSLKCMDETGSVIHIGSFSKSVFPGLRLGFILADRRVKPIFRALIRNPQEYKTL